MLRVVTGWPAATSCNAQGLHLRRFWRWSSLMTARAHRIIVIDDDAELRALIQRFLSEHGFVVRGVSDGAALDAMMQREPADALVLDLMLRGEDGLAICRRLRAAGEQVPILMLTARGDPVDRIIGLEMGADDYLAKPFTPRELVARLHAILRRTGPRAAPVRERRYRFGPYEIDLGATTLTRGGAAVALSSREFALLAALVTCAGRPLSRAQLIDRALGRDAEVTDRAIDVQITRLRKALGDDPANPAWIRTVWGVGYMLTGATEC